MARLAISGQLSVAIKADWPMSGVAGQDGSVVITLPLHDAALYNRPTKLHVVFFRDFIPNGMTAEMAVETPLHGVAVVPDQTSSTDTVFIVNVPGVSPGPYQVLLVGEYDS